MSLAGIEKFYGRKTILDLLKRRVLDLKEGYRQNVAFLGGQHVGKTFLLQKFLAEMDDPDIICVYLDLANKDLPYIYHQYVASLLYHFSKVKGLPLHEDIKLLVESTQDALPQTIKAIKRIQTLMTRRKASEAYRELLTLPQTFARETNKFCVLILEEFQHLEDLAIPQVFQELGSKIMTQKRCLYVVTSSLPAAAKKILSEKLSLLFGDFEVIPVDSFDVKTSQEFVQFSLKGIKIGDVLRDFLIDFTGGHPLFLQLICEELLNLTDVHKQDEIFIPLLAQAVENVLFHPWGVLSRHFDFTINNISPGKGNLAIPAILISLAQRKQKIKELADDTMMSERLLSQKLNRLTDMDIVVRNGKYFYLKDKLLRYWLKYVFRRRQTAVHPDPYQQREQFFGELNQAVENFKASCEKNLSSRIMELLHCFEDEAFLINGRRYKLPLFREILPAVFGKESGGSFEVMKAATSEGEWVIILKKDKVSENDLTAILTEAKGLAPKSQKCVLISLADLDENTRVRALQERMWIWNENELNALLNLYDKPYILH